MISTIPISCTFYLSKESKYRRWHYTYIIKCPERIWTRFHESLKYCFISFSQIMLIYCSHTCYRLSEQVHTNDTFNKHTTCTMVHFSTVRYRQQFSAQLIVKCNKTSYIHSLYLTNTIEVLSMVKIVVKSRWKCPTVKSKNK